MEGGGRGGGWQGSGWGGGGGGDSGHKGEGPRSGEPPTTTHRVPALESEPGQNRPCSARCGISAFPIPVQSGFLSNRHQI